MKITYMTVLAIFVALVGAVSVSICESISVAEAQRSCEDDARATHAGIAARTDDLATLCPPLAFP